MVGVSTPKAEERNRASSKAFRLFLAKKEKHHQSMQDGPGFFSTMFAPSSFAFQLKRDSESLTL